MLHLNDKAKQYVLERCKKWATREEKLRAKVAQETEKIQDDPIHALDWSGALFDAAGQLQVMQQVATNYAGADLEMAGAIVWNVLENAVRMVGHSSGETNNLMRKAVSEAWKELARELMVDLRVAEEKKP